MKIFGLIGKNISYSFSKGYFSNKFITENIVDSTYDVFDLDAIEKVTEIFKIPNLVGFNVTIPYKQEIIKYLDELSPEAREIGAVNTVLIKNGKKIGYNTDCYGFKNSILPLLKEQHSKALVLGNGGAAKAIFYVLKELGIDYKIVSRNPSKETILYEDINKEMIENYPIIINCSPVGTFPNIKNSPNIPYKYLNSNNFLYDLIYNPEVTLFLQNGIDKNTTIKNGYEMLVLQAEKSWDIWNKV